TAPPEHHSLRFLRISRECGADTSNSDRSLAAVRQSADSLQMANGRQRIKIGLCPGAEYGPAKRWLPERFAEAAERISAQSPVPSSCGIMSNAALVFFANVRLISAA